MSYGTHDQTEAMVIADRIAVMSEGLIMQVGTPEEVYNEPSNTFVAGFIGSPSMNLIDVEYTKTGNGITVKLGPSKIEINDVEPGDGIILGIRPERIQLEPFEGAVEIDAEIDFIENLGSDKILHIDVGGHILVAKTTKDINMNTGSRIKIYINKNDIKIFDKATGKRIK